MVLGRSVTVDASRSSQYVSALLMAAPMARESVEVRLADSAIGARGYIDITLGVMKDFGAQVQTREAGRWVVEPSGYTARRFAVEPDASAATYFWAAEALTGGAIALGTAPDALQQPDAQAHRIIAQFPNIPAEIDGSGIQDAVPTLAVLAAFNATPVRFVDIGNLRVKECDRIAVLAEGLNRIAPGLAAEDPSSLLVRGVEGLANMVQRPRIDPHADHRMAMSFALAGLKTNGVTIFNPDCVSKTFPRYWDELAKVGVSINFISS